MPTVGQVFMASRYLFGRVPHVTDQSCCRCCLGPVNSGFAACRACSRLLPHLPQGLRALAVPMTTAPNPSPWYTRLTTYKAGHPEYRSVLAALVATYVATHRAKIEAVLGGPHDLLAVVPSKRGIPYERQPLRAGLALAPPLAASLAPALELRPGAQLSRWTYDPEVFAAGPARVARRRVLLVDDTWVTGATALSAAGALLRDGARAVALLPLARLVDGGFWSEEHPYRCAMAAPYDPTVWPR